MSTLTERPPRFDRRTVTFESVLAEPDTVTFETFVRGEAARAEAEGYSAEYRRWLARRA